MAIKPALNQFNGGEISPQLEGRYDWDKYNYSAKLCKNFIPLVEGSLKRRGGSHFVASRRGDNLAEFVITLYSDNATPVLMIDGEIINLTQTSPSGWTSSKLVYKEGVTILLRASADGYKAQFKDITIQPSQPDIYITLRPISSEEDETATIKFVTLSNTVVNIDGEQTKNAVLPIGSTVPFSVTFEDKSISGNIEVVADETYYVLLKNEELSISSGQIIVTSTPILGSVYLPKCKVRFIGVGGGGGGYIYFPTLAYSGGSGAGQEVILSLPEGVYEYSCGKLGETRDAFINGDNATSGEKGSDTYLKVGSTEIAVSEGGGGACLSGGDFYDGEGGYNRLNSSYVDSVIWQKRIKGNGQNNDYRGGSVYNGYGAPSGWEGDNEVPVVYGTNGYLSIVFVEE